MKRYFEKISFNEFKKSYGDNKELYEKFMLPKRATVHSAGYDFYAVDSFTIKPGEIYKVQTGCKACLSADEVLMLYVRSSIGIKRNVRMCNQVGIVDADYYNNSDNEGHICVVLKNEGDKDFTLEKGEAFAQGIFMKYLLTDDDDTTTIRTGGIGSTNKKEGN